MNKQKIYKVPDVMDKLINDVMSGLYFPLPGENYKKRIILIKCNITCDLLLNTDMTLEEILDYICFPSIENLNSIFKGFIGIYPIEFRKRFKLNSGV